MIVAALAANTVVWTAMAIAAVLIDQPDGTHPSARIRTIIVAMTFSAFTAGALGRAIDG